MQNWITRFVNQRYFYHYLFWGVVLLSYFVDAAELREFNTHLFFRTLILKNGLLILLVYLHLRRLIPHYLNTRRYAAYLFSLLLTVAAGTFLIKRIENFSWGRFYRESSIFHPDNDTEEHIGHQKKIIEVESDVVVGPPTGNRNLINALTVCRYLVISFLLKFMDDFFRQREQIQQIKHEKTLAELDALKSQINPHFLFNTLNNLYGLVLERSDHAAETVLKLADIMKYVLAEGSQPSVPLQKDIDNLRNYFDLERLRLPDEADVRMELSGLAESYRIAPLLLLPIVENAFKYGVHRIRAQQFLSIVLHIREGNLSLTTRNRKPDVQETDSTSFGIGLQNVRKRLDLLYPGKYYLETSEDQTYFTLSLKLQLT